MGAALLAVIAGLAMANAVESQVRATERTETLLIQDEHSDPNRREWWQFQMNDQPSHRTYQRVHGGIGP